MNRKEGRLTRKTRQRQKISRRMIVVIACSFLLIGAIGIIISINLADVRQSKAGQNAGDKPVVIIADQEFTTEKSLEEPILNQEEIPEGAIITRKVKPIPADLTPGNSR